VTDEGKSNAHLWGASNPPEYDSWWQEFLDNPPDNASVTFQPSGLAQEADWLHLLPPDYYPNLAEGKSEDWVDVYIHGQYGRSLSGKPVFPEFRQDYHVAKQPLRYIRSPEKPLMIGLDFGLSPAAAIGQLDVQGRLLLLAAVTSEGMGISRFVREKLKPLLVERFPGHPVVLIGDPAGSQRAQTDEKSCFDILKAEGFVVRPAKTNSIQARVSAVEKFLSRQVDTGPGFLVDPRCDALIRALRGGYRYKVKPKSGEIDMSPEKNHHSHIADALQYLCLHADGGTMFGPVINSERREIKRAVAGGWT
jgi:hypothetical protein